jgi:hypothetical protein
MEGGSVVSTAQDGPAVPARPSYDDDIVPDPDSALDRAERERPSFIGLGGHDPALDWELAKDIEAGFNVGVPDGGRFHVHGVSEPRVTSTRVEVANSTLVRIVATTTITMRVGPVR